MEENKYVLDGYQFAGKKALERAQKEKETIIYLKAHTDMSDGKALLKIYNRAVTQKAFQTVIGTDFLCELRRKLISSNTVSEASLAPVPAPGSGRAVTEQMSTGTSSGEREERRKQNAQIEKADFYREKYENAVADQKIKNLLIIILIIIIIGMVIITWNSKYSVFTYFTDYETNIRNEVINEMEDWQQELEEREKKLDAAEEQK